MGSFIHGYSNETVPASAGPLNDQWHAAAEYTQLAAEKERSTAAGLRDGRICSGRRLIL